MARIGLIDVDSHNFPNLALMKISAWHKEQGDSVEWWDGIVHYDRVYQSKVFDATYTTDNHFSVLADEVITGGTGYDLKNKLPDAIEHICPDPSIYNVGDAAYGFLTRGCPRGCQFCIVPEKEGRKSTMVAEVGEWYRGQKEIILLDPNLLAAREHIMLLGQLAKTGARIDFTQGLDARMLTEDNIAALNKCRVKMVHFAWDTMEQSEAVLRGLSMYSQHGAVQDERKRRVYVLTNFNTSREEDLYRIYRLREIGFDPYVMVFDKPHSAKEKRKIQRWVNNKRIFRSCTRFEDYKG